MRVVVLGDLATGETLHYALAFKARGHDVRVVDITPRPDPAVRAVRQLAGVEVLAPYAGEPEAAERARRLEYLLWAGTDKLRGPLRPAARLGAWAFGRVARSEHDRVARLVEGLEPEAVFTLWGRKPYPELLAMQRLPRRRFALVHNWNTYPPSDELVGARDTNWLDEAIARRLDVRVHASAREQHDMAARMRLAQGLDVVFPDSFNESSRPRRRLPLLRERDGEPHLVYHGIYGVDPQDHIAPQVRAMADAGIHVHHGVLRDAPVGHPRVHPYQLFSVQEFLDGALFEHSTQFDAGLMTLNVRRPYRRFQNWVTTRVLSGIASGIPIALRHGILPATQDLVEEHGNGFTYTDERDLRAKLLDEGLMASVRKAALDLEPRFTLERRLPALEEAMERAVAARVRA